MKNKKFLLYIVLLSASTTIFTGCTKELKEVQYTSAADARSFVTEEDTRFHTNMIGGQDYATGSHMEVLEANPLELTTLVSTDSQNPSYENSYYVYQQLTGLQDTPIEKEINKHIKSAVADWCENRPIPSDDTYNNASEEARDGAYYGVSTSITFNHCDYLSGIFNYSIDYYDPQTMEHSRYMRTSSINFDLRTGEQFTLAALFAESYDYKSAVASGALEYCKAKGLNPTDLRDIADHSAFCLSVNGLVIYPDSTYLDQGIASGTAIVIPFSHFGSNWAISRSCSDIYTSDGKGTYILLANPGETLVSESTDLYAKTADDGSVVSDSRLSVVLNHTYPNDFPEGLFDRADAFADTYRPSTNLIWNISRNEELFVLQTYDSVGTRIGGYCCVTLNAIIRESGEFDISAVRQYVFDKSGQPVELSACFTQDFDINSVVSGKLAETVNTLMDEGWTIESEIDMGSIDFMLGTDAMTFSTAPLRRSRVVTAADGTQTKETVCESLMASSTYEEIGMENLTIFQLE